MSERVVRIDIEPGQQTGRNVDEALGCGRSTSG